NDHRFPGRGGLPACFGGGMAAEVEEGNGEADGRQRNHDGGVGPVGTLPYHGNWNGKSLCRFPCIPFPAANNEPPRQEKQSETAEEGNGPPSRVALHGRN